MVIAVLAIQGAFAEHEHILDQLHIEHFQIRQKKDAERHFDGLILPGGESTVMGKLLKELDLFSILQEKISQGLPVFGTCAGLILLANELSNDTNRYLATMPIVVKRNAYGRQLGSFYTNGFFDGIDEAIPMTFIRAPYIEKLQGETKILSVVDGKIVAARYKKQLVTAFHPELNNDVSVHQYFINMITS